MFKRIESIRVRVELDPEDASESIRAEAEVATTDDPAGPWLLNTIRSGGLHGIADYTPEYVLQIGREECDALADVLRAFGFDQGLIDHAVTVALIAIQPEAARG